MSDVSARPEQDRSNVPCQLGAETLRADVVVIGGGSAGLTASQVAAATGRQVILVERDRLGGECLYTGCVPSKTLLAVAKRVHEARSAGMLGMTVRGAPSWHSVRSSLHRSTLRLREADSPRALQHVGVRVVNGTARFTAHRMVELRCGDHTHRIEGREFVLATGSQAVVPSIPGLRDVPFLTHETVFGLPERPGHLLILGGGTLGCEMAQAFVRLGSDVTLVEREDRLLPSDEPEASAALLRALERDGVRVRLGRSVREVEQAGEWVRATIDDGSTIEATHLLLALGKRPRVRGLGLDVIEAAHDEHGLKVDARMRSVNVPYLRGAGDVVGRPMFTHGATERGVLAGLGATGPVGRLLAWIRAPAARAEDIPRVTYTDPEIGHWGLTEREAVRRYGRRVRVVEYDLAQLGRAVMEDEGGFVKLVVLAGWLGTPLGLRVVGAQAVASRAGELIQMIGLGARLRIHPLRLALLPAPYPTYAEAVRQAYLGLFVRGQAFGRQRAGRA